MNTNHKPRGEDLMRIFVYINIIKNYCSGEYYFVAKTRATSYQLARVFAKEHNEKVNNNSNYTIEWGEEVKEYKVEEGYLPLNRIKLDLIK